LAIAIENMRERERERERERKERLFLSFGEIKAPQGKTLTKLVFSILSYCLFS
jgi:hypothetical protein